jgi:hypothetical protein
MGTFNDAAKDDCGACPAARENINGHLIQSSWTEPVAFLKGSRKTTLFTGPGHPLSRAETGPERRAFSE